MKALTELLKNDGRASDPIWVWMETGLIVDGHNRFDICSKNDLKFDVQQISFPDRSAALKWMVLHQQGRRNIPPQRMSELRGQTFNEANRQRRAAAANGAAQNSPEDRKKYDKSPRPVSRAKIAKDFEVTERTILNDAKYAEAMSNVTPRVRSRLRDDGDKLTLSRSDTQKLALLTSQQQIAFAKEFDSGKHGSAAKALAFFTIGLGKKAATGKPAAKTAKGTKKKAAKKTAKKTSGETLTQQKNRRKKEKAAFDKAVTAVEAAVRRVDDYATATGLNGTPAHRKVIDSFTASHALFLKWHENASK